MWIMRWSDWRASGGRLFSSTAHGNIFLWPGLYHHLDVLRVPCFAWRDSPASGVFPTTFGLRAKHLSEDLSAYVVCSNENSKYNLDFKCYWIILAHYALIKRDATSFSSVFNRIQLIVCSCQHFDFSRVVFLCSLHIPTSCLMCTWCSVAKFPLFCRPFIQSFSTIMKSCFSCLRQ